MFFDCVFSLCIFHELLSACFLNVCFKCMFVWVFHTSLSIYVCASLSLCPFLFLFVFSLVAVSIMSSSSLCDFAERGPGSGCHPLPPSQHCPRSSDQRHPAAHRLPALSHQPAPHLHRPAVRGAGALLRKHRTLLPGVQRPVGPLQRLWICWIYEERLCFKGPLWAAGPTIGMLQHWLKWLCHRKITIIYSSEKVCKQNHPKEGLFDGIKPELYFSKYSRS